MFPGTQFTSVPEAKSNNNYLSHLAKVVQQITLSITHSVSDQSIRYRNMSETMLLPKSLLIFSICVVISCKLTE